MITQKRIDEINKLVEMATDGPWFTKPTPKDNKGWPTCQMIAATAASPHNRIFAQPKAGTAPAANQNFIAESRTIVPELLDEVTRLRDENEKLSFHLRNALPYYLRTGFGGASEASELLEQLKTNREKDGE